MHRRQFLRSGVMVGAATALAAPAIAQSQPNVKWRLTSGFPKSLDTIYGAADVFSRAVSEITDGNFQISPFSAGEIVGTFQAVDAVSTGTVEMCHTASLYYTGKDPTFGLGTNMPFGLNTRMMNAWLYHAGGTDILNQFYAKHNMISFPGGNTGGQMGGWFRKEIATLQDLRGLKFRVGGLGGQVFSRLGAVPQQIAGGEIYSALERGTIDAVEWVGPYDDEKLGFNKVAPYYYYPGFFDCGPTMHFFTNLQKWNDLPKSYQAAIRTAASHANIDMTAKYDARNPAALRRLVAAGAQLRAFSTEILDAAYKAAMDYVEETSATNEDFKKVADHMLSFRADEYLWFQVTEYAFDSYMIRRRASR
jgi:TRAP-type mannitol/chloroaromatic compound transport system substrate-binding protein